MARKSTRTTKLTNIPYPKRPDLRSALADLGDGDRFIRLRAECTHFACQEQIEAVIVRMFAGGLELLGAIEVERMKREWSQHAHCGCSPIAWWEALRLPVEGGDDGG